MHAYGLSMLDSDAQRCSPMLYTVTLVKTMDTWEGSICSTSHTWLPVVKSSNAGGLNPRKFAQQPMHVGMVFGP